MVELKLLFESHINFSDVFQSVARRKSRYGHNLILNKLFGIVKSFL
jgi:hypothetical protein